MTTTKIAASGSLSFEPKNSSPTAPSMDGVLKALAQQHYDRLERFISLQESVYGTLSSSHSIVDYSYPFGQQAARASPFQLRAKKEEQVTQDTSGQKCSDSSEKQASIDLSRSVASRLQAKTARSGSTMFRLTWKEKVTPSGNVLPWLVASVPRTNGSGSTSSPWPTPTARDHKDGQKCNAVKINGLLGRVAWLTVADIPTRRTASGQVLTGSDAQIASGGRLNPAFSLWLMGLPKEWDVFVEPETPSVLPKPPHSLKHSSSILSQRLAKVMEELNDIIREMRDESIN